jgi:hypothetical protein
VWAEFTDWFSRTWIGEAAEAIHWILNNIPSLHGQDTTPRAGDWFVGGQANILNQESPFVGGDSNLLNWIFGGSAPAPPSLPGAPPGPALPGVPGAPTAPGGITAPGVNPAIAALQEELAGLRAAAAAALEQENLLRAAREALTLHGLDQLGDPIGQRITDGLQQAMGQAQGSFSARAIGGMGIGNRIGQQLDRLVAINGRAEAHLARIEGNTRDGGPQFA